VDLLTIVSRRGSRRILKKNPDWCSGSISPAGPCRAQGAWRVYGLVFVTVTGPACCRASVDLRLGRCLDGLVCA